MGYVSHRWTYEASWQRWRCVPPDLGAVPSPTRCPGCGIVVADREVCGFLGGEPLVFVASTLNVLVMGRGQAP